MTGGEGGELLFFWICYFSSSFPFWLLHLVITSFFHIWGALDLSLNGEGSPFRIHQQEKQQLPISALTGCNEK